MTIQPFNVANGLSVGETSEITVISETGNIAANSLTVAGTANLGPVANVIIDGGTTGQVLSTDGSGNLSWVTGSSYSNADVAAYLASGNNSTGFVSTGNVTLGTAPAIPYDAMYYSADGTVVTLAYDPLTNPSYTVGESITISGATSVTGMDGTYTITEVMDAYTVIFDNSSVASTGNLITMFTEPVTVTGPATIGHFIGDGSLLTDLPVPTQIANGNSSVYFDAVNGNIRGSVNGTFAMKITQNAVAIGSAAGVILQGANTVAIGAGAGWRNQGADAVAIGAGAANYYQSANAISIGGDDGSEANQGVSAVSIGYNSGMGNQGANAVAVGVSTGGIDQGANAVAIGSASGNNTQGANAVAIGTQAGQVNQGINAVAIGAQAGQPGQGANAVAIGAFAGANLQVANSVVINATGANLDGANEGFYVAPVRNDTGNTTNALYYNTTTKELTYGPGGAASYGNADVAAYLASGTDTQAIITTGNISGSNLIVTGTTTLVDSSANATTFSSDSPSNYAVEGAQPTGISPLFGPAGSGDGAIFFPNYQTTPLYDSITVTPAEKLTASGDYTVEAWFAQAPKTGYAPGESGPIYSTAGTSTRNYGFVIGTWDSETNTPGWFVQDVDTGLSILVNDTNVYSGGWHHIAVSVSSGVATLYGDGVEVGNGTVTGTTNFGDLTSLGAYIGVNPQSSDSITPPEFIYDVRISNVARYTTSFTPTSYGTDANTLLFASVQPAGLTANSIMTGSFTASGVVNLGSDSNLLITGGESGQYLSALGNTGQVNWGPVSFLGTTNNGIDTGNSGIQLLDGANSGAGYIGGGIVTLGTQSGGNGGINPPGLGVVAVGAYAGANGVGDRSIAIGHSAQRYYPSGANSITIGVGAGGEGIQGAESVIIGTYAGGNAIGSNLSQGNYSVAIGSHAANGYSIDTGRQADYAVALGAYAAASGQDNYTVAIGYAASQAGQGANSISIGAGSNTAYGISSIAIGTTAKASDGDGSIAIGANATSDGNNSIVIGANATSGVNNIVVLDASGTDATTVSASGFYVAPVRNDTGNTTNALYYNTTTKELTYGPGGGGSGTVTQVGGDGSALGFTLSGNITTTGNLTLAGPSATDLRTTLGIGNVANANFNGNSSQVLAGDGTWIAAGGGGGTPAGSNTQVQFNNAGAFGSSANFVYDNVANSLGVSNLVLLNANGNAGYMSMDSYEEMINIVAPAMNANRGFAAINLTAATPTYANSNIYNGPYGAYFSLGATTNSSEYNDAYLDIKMNGDPGNSGFTAGNSSLLMGVNKFYVSTYDDTKTLSTSLNLTPDYASISVVGGANADALAGGVTAGLLLESDSFTYLGGAARNYGNSGVCLRATEILANSSFANAQVGQVWTVTRVQNAAQLNANVAFMGLRTIAAGAGANAIVLGTGAGANSSNSTAVSIGYYAGYANSAANSISVGYQAGYTGQGASAISIGTNAGNTNQGINSIAIGLNAGANAHGANSVALGYGAGWNQQGVQSVAIGWQAGNTTQGANTISIGTQAGSNAQLAGAIAIGYQAGNNSQSANSVAIGWQAGNITQGANSIAIGNQAGSNVHGASAIAIGYQAGFDRQGANAIAIGYLAGNSQQVANSIIINASGTALNASTNAGFYVNPVRNDTGNVTNAVYFNTTTKELTYGPGSSGTPASIANGTSNVNIAASGGNVTVGVGGTANVIIATTTGVNVAGTLTATGNVTGPNIIATGNIYLGANIRATQSGTKLMFYYGATAIASIDSGGNLICAGNITAFGTP